MCIDNSSNPKDSLLITCIHTHQSSRRQSARHMTNTMHILARGQAVRKLPENAGIFSKRCVVNHPIESGTCLRVDFRFKISRAKLNIPGTPILREREALLCSNQQYQADYSASPELPLRLGMASRGSRYPVVVYPRGPRWGKLSSSYVS